jgi:DNA-binding winged helix-turn-helix (wHTH) protein
VRVARRHFDGFELDPDRGILHRGGTPIHLTPLTFRLLGYLARHHPRIVPREELLREVWPGVHVTQASLHQAIRGLRRALAPHPELVENVRGLGYRLGGSEAGRPHDAPADPLVGRDAPLARLDAAVAAAVDGHGGLVLVTGEPGIGRSRFLREGVARARAAGTRAILMRCNRFTSALPLWPWAEIVAALSSEPTLDAAGSQPPIGEPIEPERVRRTVLEASRVRPLCLFLDDLGGAHAASWRVLEWIASAADDSRLLLVAASRDTSSTVAPERIEPIARLLRVPRARTEPLPRLSRKDVRSLAATALGSTPSARRVRELHARSGGNPFLLKLLLDSAASRGQRPRRTSLEDPRIRRAAAAHLDVVGSEARGWLARAAALGREFDVAQLAVISKCSLNDLRDALAPACECGVLEAGPSGRSLRFSHGLLAEVACGELPASERQRLQDLANEVGSGLHLRGRSPGTGIVSSAPRARAGRGFRSR